jgi:hypothetical protein
MSQKRIPPSLVVHAIRYGQKYQAKINTCDIYQDNDFDVIVAVDRKKKKVLNVGYKRDIAIIDVQPKPKPEPELEKEKLPLFLTDGAVESAPQEVKPLIPETKPEAEKKPKKTLENIIAEAKRGEATKGKTKVFIKPGLKGGDGFRDFDDVEKGEVKDISCAKGTGKTAKLPDGRHITIRDWSEDTRPTLEIYNPKNSSYIKIRYGEKNE